jgi:hypothetical protein
MAAKRRKILVFALLGLIVSLFSVPAGAESVARRVNRDDKSFKGTWVHKIKTPGQDLFSVISKAGRGRRKGSHIQRLTARRCGAGILWS